MVTNQCEGSIGLCEIKEWFGNGSKPNDVYQLLKQEIEARGEIPKTAVRKLAGQAWLNKGAPQQTEEAALNDFKAATIVLAIRRKTQAEFAGQEAFSFTKVL